EKLMDERGEAVARDLDLLDPAPLRRPAQLVSKHRRMTLDRRHDVVEIRRNAGRDATQHLHLCRATRLLLDQLQLRDVSAAQLDAGPAARTEPVLPEDLDRA